MSPRSMVRRRSGLYVPRAVSLDAYINALSPIELLKLDDTSGTSAAAAVGSAGTYVGSPTLAAAGIVADGGTSVTLDGNTQEITVPVSGLGSAGSILFSFKSTDASSSILFRDNTTTTGWFIQLGTTTLTPNVRVNNGNHSINPVLSSNTLRDGNKQQILLTTDGTTVTFYSKGVQMDQWAPTNGLFSGIVSPLHFGRNGLNTGTSNFYAIGYDYIAVFPTALTPTNASTIWSLS